MMMEIAILVIVVTTIILPLLVFCIYLITELFEQLKQEQNKTDEEMDDIERTS